VIKVLSHDTHEVWDSHESLSIPLHKLALAQSAKQLVSHDSFGRPVVELIVAARQRKEVVACRNVALQVLLLIVLVKEGYGSISQQDAVQWACAS
jgi:hypothetical protein